MTRSLQPIDSNGLSIPRANVLLGDVGSKEFFDVGDCENFSLTLDVQEVERYGKNYSTKTLRRSDVIQLTATVSFEIVDMTKFMRALSVGSNTTNTYAQASANSASEVFAARAGYVYKLPHMNVSVSSITDASGLVEFAIGSDVVVLEDSGYIQVLNGPSGADSQMVVTYSAPEIAASNGVLMSGIGSDLDIRKAINIVGINKVGPRDMLVLHDVQLRKDGGKDFIGGDDYSTMTITGKVFADSSKAEGFQLGHLITLD